VVVCRRSSSPRLQCGYQGGPDYRLWGRSPQRVGGSPESTAFCAGAAAFRARGCGTGGGFFIRLAALAPRLDVSPRHQGKRISKCPRDRVASAGRVREALREKHLAGVFATKVASERVAVPGRVELA